MSSAWSATRCVAIRRAPTTTSLPHEPFNVSKSLGIAYVGTAPAIYDVIDSSGVPFLPGSAGAHWFACCDSQNRSVANIDIHFIYRIMIYRIMTLRGRSRPLSFAHQHQLVRNVAMLAT